MRVVSCELQAAYSHRSSGHKEVPLVGFAQNLGAGAMRAPWAAAIGLTLLAVLVCYGVVTGGRRDINLVETLIAEVSCLVDTERT